MYETRSSRFVPLRWVLVGGFVLVIAGFGIGFTAGASGEEGNSLLVGSVLSPPDVDFSPVWKAWLVIDEKFAPAANGSTTTTATTTKAEKDQKRIWGMIQGLAESLGDPYTYFLPPVENEQFAEDMSGRFEGVGMEIAVRDQILTVVSPLKGTPAEAAGIESGDKILEIDGFDTSGIDIEKAVTMIRGPKGSQVILTIEREGWSESRDISVTRDVINVPLVDTELRDDGVFVIQLASFTANSPQLFREALREFVESGSSMLILDIRGNPGGYLEAAVDMASWFLPSGRLVVEEEYASPAGSTPHRSRGYNVFNENLRMVVLVNRGSASASEILAEALRYYGVAQIVGVNTFGKGSVQELVDITPETALKITVARWLGPGGRQIPLSGLEPDIEVEITDEDREAGLDPQTEKAVELLLEEQ